MLETVGLLGSQNTRQILCPSSPRGRKGKSPTNRHELDDGRQPGSCQCPVLQCQGNEASGANLHGSPR